MVRFHLERPNKSGASVMASTSECDSGRVSSNLTPHPNSDVVEIDGYYQAAVTRPRKLEVQFLPASTNFALVV